GPFLLCGILWRAHKRLFPTLEILIAGHSVHPATVPQKNTNHSNPQGNSALGEVKSAVCRDPIRRVVCAQDRMNAVTTSPPPRETGPPPVGAGPSPASQKPAPLVGGLPPRAGGAP